MKKKMVLLLIGIFMLTGSLVFADMLQEGYSITFLKNGEKIIAKVIDVSRTRNVIELQDTSGDTKEIKLAEIWMINFINTKWDFPKERDKIVTAEHYFFLKNSEIISGRIIDFSRNLKVFELNTGEKIRIGSIRRIYFSKNPPNEFKKELETKRVIKKH